MTQQCACGAIGVHFGCPVALAFRIEGPNTARVQTDRRPETVSPSPMMRLGCGGTRDLRPGARPSPIVLG